MDAKELTLNIAVNLGRIGRWASEGKTNRLKQFLAETEEFVLQLDAVPQTPRFRKTFNAFKANFEKLRNEKQIDLVWAESMLTWANILTHRSQLA